MTDGTGHKGETRNQEEETGDKDITKTPEGQRRLKHSGQRHKGNLTNNGYNWAT